MTVPSDSSPPKVPTGPRSTPRLAAVARADDLRSRIAAREERALAELVELTSPWLLGVAHGMIQEPDEAEEVVLETFRAAWEKVPKPNDGDRGLIAWLLQVARHKAVDRLRARKRRLRLRDRVATLESGVTSPVEPDEAAHPGWHIHASVHQALALLPDEQRAQVGFSTDGSRLVVTEKATNRLVTFPVNPDGTPGTASTQPSAGPTPFGFAFDKRGTLIVSEAFGGAADASVLSSYRASAGGWMAVTPLAATTETAACWVVVTPNGRFVYTTNTGSASVSGYRVDQDGSLQLLDPDGVTASTGAGPIDADVSRNGRYLYTLNSGSGSVGAYRIEADGSLIALGESSGLPAGANGLVAH